jgi:hypothetical protein
MAAISHGIGLKTGQNIKLNGLPEPKKDSTSFVKEQFPIIWKEKRVNHFSFSTAC